MKKQWIDTGEVSLSVGASIKDEKGVTWDVRAVLPLRVPFIHDEIGQIALACSPLGEEREFIRVFPRRLSVEQEMDFVSWITYSHRVAVAQRVEIKEK